MVVNNIPIWLFSHNLLKRSGELQIAETVSKTKLFLILNQCVRGSKIIPKHSQEREEKSRIRETPNLLTDADSSTNIFVSAGVKKGTNSIFFFQIYVPNRLQKFFVL